jgi:GT2 family glycosyltransferase
MRWLKGCNFSCYKLAMMEINGFDEDYQKPAIGEDIDLTWRFKGLGYRLISARNYAVQYHLYHKENWTSQEENECIMAQKQAKQAYVCSNGLKKLN